jgi:acetoin utilization deacetylase AcuC-like enzyme
VPEERSAGVRGRTPGRRLYYCDHYAFALPPGHKFPVRKYALVREQLTSLFDLQPSPLATPEALTLAHDADYVTAVLHGAAPAEAMRRIGFPWSEGLVLRTLASVGGTLSAARDAMQTGFGGNLAGGTHHAFRGWGAGFCVFNDLAVAVRDLRCKGLAHRPAIVDLDVHQGDGTAAIFADDDAVLTVSVHSRNNFPFRKQRSRLDIELDDGLRDGPYLQHVDRVLRKVFAFRPDIVLYQSGVDGLAGDRLGRLALTEEGLQERDRRVLEGCRRHGVPVAVTLGGGYADPVDRTARAHANTFRVAAEVFGVY